MSKRTPPNGRRRVTFANNATLDGKQYKQGETYDVSPADARHLLHVGKVRLADEGTERTAEPAPADTAPTAPARAGTES